MQWTQLLCEKRYRSYRKHKSGTDLRSEFQKDYHRIICSASFRRLQDKTQVFPLDNSDFIRTRLTHSLEVSSFAKSLGQMAFQYLIDHGTDPQVDGLVKEQVCSILECAGLLHDIGNPPFGHFGEDAIRSWFRENLPRLHYKGRTLDTLLDPQMQQDLCCFEGNAQALRLLTKLHYLIDENGMHLTYALLNTLIKYPVPSCGIDKSSPDIRTHKMGYYLAEEEIFKDITGSTGAVGCRYPLTFLLEAADDIAYLTADTEDAVKKGVLTYDCLLRELEARQDPLAPPAQQACYDEAVRALREKLSYAQDKHLPDPEMNAVQNWVIHVQGTMLRCAAKSFTDHYAAIMDGSFPSDLLSVSETALLTRALAGIAVQYIYDSDPILTLEVSAAHILHDLMDRFVPAAIRYDTDEPLTPVQDRLMRILSLNYREIYAFYSKDRPEAYRLYLRLLLVTDHICGMTDSFAKRMYQQFCGIL
ncbi:MAG: deoxyguanosinetriphosphate triphosphohydrolase [Oscillospiraceae bacterium]|nr:deoxyguanosinetriphosphate triphosphohydrolase [Oscillospiraceae bacterium]